jgi:hypothetical protein
MSGDNRKANSVYEDRALRADITRKEGHYRPCPDSDVLGGPLGNTGNRATPPRPAKRQKGRDERHSLKRLQRSLTASRAAGLCCFARGETVTVDVGRALTAHVSNVYRCGSPWSCPVCAPVVRQRRADEIDRGLRHHLDAGGGALFVTLTLRHHRGDTLASRLDPIARSLRLSLNGAPWKRRRDALGYVGAMKAVEITHGANGWHPHSHSLLLFERPATEIERRDLESWLFGRWLGIATKRGLGTVSEANGVDVRQVSCVGSLSEYLTVVEGGWSPGLELARSDRKSRSPFELLRFVLGAGDGATAALWREYEAATFGRRAIVWSPGLRRRLLGHELEVSDEELAASEGMDLALLRWLCPADAWNATVRNGTTGELLSEVERAAALVLFIADCLGHDVPILDLPTPEVART